MTINQPTFAMKEFINMAGNPYQDSFLDVNNNIAIISGVLSVSQTVKNAISLFLREYQFNTTIGIPWATFLGNPLNRTLLNNFLTTAILAVAYVTSVVSIDYVTDDLNRILAINII
jgi:hypothetical protein